MYGSDDSQHLPGLVHRYLRLLDIAHLASGPADLATGSKRLLRLLCALFEKLERKHGVSLYQKPKQVLKPRPRSAAPAGGSGGRDHTDKENGPGSSLAPAVSLDVHCMLCMPARGVAIEFCLYSVLTHCVASVCGLIRVQLVVVLKGHLR